MSGGCGDRMGMGRGEWWDGDGKSMSAWGHGVQRWGLEDGVWGMGWNRNMLRSTTDEGMVVEHLERGWGKDRHRMVVEDGGQWMGRENGGIRAWDKRGDNGRV